MFLPVFEANFSNEASKINSTSRIKKKKQGIKEEERTMKKKKHERKDHYGKWDKKWKETKERRRWYFCKSLRCITQSPERFEDLSWHIRQCLTALMKETRKNEWVRESDANRSRSRKMFVGTSHWSASVDTVRCEAIGTHSIGFSIFRFCLTIGHRAERRW